LLLKKEGLPTSDYIVGENYYVQVDKVYYSLTKKIEGHHLKIEDLYTDEIAIQVGEVMADLHLALKDLPYTLEEVDFRVELQTWIKDALDASGESYASKKFYQEFHEALNEVYHDLPRQNIHRDFHLNNFLVRQGKISGIIDFDISQNNIRLFDIAYFSVGLLSQNIPYESWQSIHHQLLKGSSSKINLSNKELNACNLLMAGIEILFVAYFDRNKHYDLAKNADQTFMRLWEKFNENRIC
jgi:Ser/Thr protein kinase RdoA (MazF antagonist)